MSRIGLSLGLSPREPIDRLVALGRQAEAGGIGHCWLVDSQLAMKDAVVALAVLARETEQLRVGPGVTNLVTRHETVVANAMATLADMAPGRIEVGVGAGDSAVFPIGERPLGVEDCRRGVQRLRALLAGEAVEGPGGELRLSFTPSERPPIFFAGSQPRMLQLAGAVADGVIVMGPSDPDTVRMQMAHVDDGARAAGRDPRDVQRDLWVTLSIGEGQQPSQDVKSWASAQARWLTTWKHVPASLEPFRAEMEEAARTYDFGDHLSLRADHASTISDEFARVLAVAGTPDECTDRLSSLLAAGADRVTVTLLSGGRERRLSDIIEVWSDVERRSTVSAGR